MTVLTFLSDYGPGDEYVGVVHGVIARIAPGVRVIDLGHGVPPQDVRTGARRLARALPYTPAGVHLAVVDPGVGGTRRAIAARAGERWLVGPDNGLLSVVAARAKACAYWRITWRPGRTAAAARIPCSTPSTTGARTPRRLARWA